MFLLILMDWDDKSRCSALEGLAKKLANALVKEGRASGPIVVFGASFQDRLYVYENILQELVARGQKFDASIASEFKPGDTRYSINLDWYVQMVDEMHKTPEVSVS